MLIRGIQRAFRLAAPHFPGNLLRVAALAIGGVRLGAGARVGRGTRMSRGCRVGRRSRVGMDAALDDVQLADACTVGDFARLSLVTAGEGTHIETNVLCLGARRNRITIGRHCYVGVGAVLDHSSAITIGDFVHIAGPATALHTHSSVPMALHGAPLDEDRRQYGEIQVGSHSWVGGHVSIYPGRRIGDHCVVLPNSVVAEDVESHTMVGGVPAHVVRLIERDEKKGSAGREPIPPGRTLS